MARAAPTFRRFVKSITINDGGSNYSSVVGDTFLYIGPPSGAPETSPIQAAGSISVINGAIASITITEPGDGYANVPEVYIQSGIGTGTNSLTFLGSADSRRDAGTYVNVDVVSGKDGTGAKATVVVDGTGNVTSVNITTSGSRYMEGETVTITDISIGGVNNAPDMTFSVNLLKSGGNGADLTAVTDIIAGQVGYLHDQMSYIVDSQIPDFVLDEYPNFARFIKDYYRFLDLSDTDYDNLNLSGDQSPNYLLQELIDKLNVDHYDEDFLDLFLEQYALDFPQTAVVNKKLLLKHIREFFEAKGSRKGVELFFRIMYNEPVEVFLPSQYILKPSDGIWTTELTIKVYPNDEIFPHGDPFLLRGRRVDVVYYESTASITKKVRINTAVTRIKKIAYTNPSAYELTLDIPGGTVIPGPGVEAELTAVIGGKIATVDTIGAADVLRTAGTYDIDSGFTTDGNGTGAEFTIIVDGSGAATVTVDTVGDNYAPDETITIPDSLLGSGGAADLTFDVATITDGKIFSVTINNGGAGYSANPAVIIQPDPADTITTAAVIDTRLTNGVVSSTVFVNDVKGLGYNNVPTLSLNTDAFRTWIGFEGVEDVLSNKNSFLTRVLNTATIVTNSGASDGGFTAGNTFVVSETGDILGVYALDYFGQDYTITGISNNALVRVKNVGADNYPTVVEIIATGTGFQRSSFEFILRSSNSETCTLTCTTGYSYTYPGSQKDSRGFLSDANKLQDNRIYQNFSYLVKTSRPKTEWGELLDRIAHPAGMIAWTDLQINQTINFRPTISARTDIIAFWKKMDVEEILISDAPVLTFERPVTDSVNMSDQRTGASDDTILLFPNLGKFETPSVADNIEKFDVTTAYSDSVDLSELVAKDVALPAIEDSITFGEVVEALKFIFRNPTDSLEMSEAVSLTIALFKTDSVDMSEVVSKEPGLVKTEDPTVNDAVDNFDITTAPTEDPTVDENSVLLFTNATTDDAALADSGLVIIQNYAEDYFLEDYVGESRNF